MHIESLAKLIAPSAEEICVRAAAGGFQLPDSHGASPAEFLNELIAGGKLSEAVQFFAFALPPREAVWWACSCTRAHARDPLSPPLAEALDAAETWVRRPTEEHRRVAMQRAQATDFQSPAAWVAVAAFWSGGSMAPENLPELPPAAHLLGIAVAGAITLAAVQSEPLAADRKRQHYLASAVDIANGGSGRSAVGG